MTTSYTLTTGEVEISLDGETRTLRPTLDAFAGIGARYDIGPLLEKLRVGNVATFLDVLRLGLGLSADEARELPAKLMRTGVLPLINPLSDYAFRLFNGGKSAAEIAAEPEVKEGARPL